MHAVDKVALNLKILKSSGTYLKRKAYQYLILWILCLLVFVVVFLTIDPLLPLYIDLGRYDGPRAVAMILPLIGVLVFYRRHRDYKRGFEGENQVTRVLSSALSDDYVLINDVQLDVRRRSNIDHVVLGPTGIFVLETKNHGGKIVFAMKTVGRVWGQILLYKHASTLRESIRSLRLPTFLHQTFHGFKQSQFSRTTEQN